MARRIRTAEELAAREVRKAASNDRMYDEAEALIRPIEGVSIGYIGNVSTLHKAGVPMDDRAWYIFLPHPGRVGQREDSLGGYPTEERGKLVRFARTLSIGWRLGQGVYR